MQHVAQQALGGVSRVGTAAEVSTSKLWLGPPTKKRACVCGEWGMVARTVSDASRGWKKMHRLVNS